MFVIEEGKYLFFILRGNMLVCFSLDVTVFHELRSRKTDHILVQIEAIVHIFPLDSRIVCTLLSTVTLDGNVAFSPIH